VSVLDSIPTPPGWSADRLGVVSTRVSETGFPNLQSLSVFLGDGVVPRGSRDDNYNQLGADPGKYQRVLPGDVVFNKLRTWQGGFGVSQYEGIVSPAYIIIRPHPGINSRFLHHLLRSEPYIAELTRLSKWMPPSQFDIAWEDLRGLPLRLPSQHEQSRIADFLDDQVVRIDKVVSAREIQSELVECWRTESISLVMFGGKERRVALVSMAEVRLGRQRTPQSEIGNHMTRYLRSANVSDGYIDLLDVNEMNFEPAEQAVFALRSGDVLVTEGAGSPKAVGASAIWDGREEGLCFQNTLLRIRPRDVAISCDYLGWWARASHFSGAMRTWASGASILHLGSEGLKRMPIPQRDAPEQARIVQECARIEEVAVALKESLMKSVNALTEYKRSIITSAVTGEFDVSSASDRGMTA